MFFFFTFALNLMIYTSHVFYNHYLIYLSIKITNKCSFTYTHAPAPALLFFVQILIKRNISFFGFPAFPSLIAKALKDRRIVFTFVNLILQIIALFLKGYICKISLLQTWTLKLIQMSVYL